MEQYIKKSALVQYLTGIIESACCDENTKRIIRKLIIPHIDALEVEKVNLDKEIKKYSMELSMKENNGDWLKDITATAKHFFELGMAVSNKEQKGE